MLHVILSSIITKYPWGSSPLFTLLYITHGTFFNTSISRWIVSHNSIIVICEIDKISKYQYRYWTWTAFSIETAFEGVHWQVRKLHSISTDQCKYCVSDNVQYICIFIQTIMSGVFGWKEMIMCREPTSRKAASGFRTQNHWVLNQKHKQMIVSIYCKMTEHNIIDYI